MPNVKSYPACPYCGEATEIVNSERVYNRDFGDLLICTRYPECDSYVGCHDNSGKPKGTIANRALRKLRQQCHAKFDPLWHPLPGEFRKQARVKLYRWLSEGFAIPQESSHIAMLDDKQCRQLLHLLDTHDLARELQLPRIVSKTPRLTVQTPATRA